MCTSCIYNVFVSKQLTCKLADEGGSAWQGDGTETNNTLLLQCWGQWWLSFLLSETPQWTASSSSDPSTSIPDTWWLPEERCPSPQLQRTPAPAQRLPLLVHTQHQVHDSGLPPVKYKYTHVHTNTVTTTTFKHNDCNFLQKSIYQILSDSCKQLQSLFRRSEWSELSALKECCW